MKSRFCAAAAVLAILILSFAGCGGEERRETPAPTGAASASTGAEGPSAVKAGEQYRYLVWNVYDPEHPYEALSDLMAEARRQRREQLQEEYGITIEYVKAPESNWDTTAMEAAYTGAPLADIVDLGGNYNVLRILIITDSPEL